LWPGCEEQKLKDERQTANTNNLGFGDRMLRASDVAELLDLPLQTVWKYARQGVIGGVVRVGRQIRFDPEELRTWIAEGGASLECGWRREPR
jgi:excisionase family DNA binding protein